MTAEDTEKTLRLGEQYDLNKECPGSTDRETSQITLKTDAFCDGMQTSHHHRDQCNSDQE